MALLHLLARVHAGRGGTLRAVTVDHRLRPESADEALLVGQFCAWLGVEHDTLVWSHGPLTGNLSDAARRARYGLVGAWARANGIGHVALGHTADDQAETFLMELARRAGIDGLSAMRGSWAADGLRWSRPLLAVSRASLRDYLVRHGIGWIDDPTNEDDRYQRARARRALAALAPLGISAEGLAHVSANIALARGDLVALALRSADEMARDAAGAIALDLAEWKGLGNDTARRLLIAALRWVASAPYAPRAEAVARVDAAIRQSRDATLAGCRVRVIANAIRITREPRAVAGLETPTDAIWDGRWRLSGPQEPGLHIRAVGAEGLRQCKEWRATGCDRPTVIVTPAIWRGETLIAAPLAGVANGWTAEIVAGFRSFLLSH